MLKEFIFILFFSISFNAFSQTLYKEGYLLKGRDTIPCKVLYDNGHPSFTYTVKAMVDGQAIEYTPGGPVTGFAITDENINLHYGAVHTVGMYSKKLYIQKRVVGAVELYEHHYNIYKTRRTTDGSKGATTSESYTEYYIARPDNPSLSSPSILPAFKKKRIAPYIADHPGMLEREDKKLTLAECISILRAYNDWHRQNIYK